MKRLLFLCLLLLPAWAAAPSLADIQQLGPLHLKLPMNVAEKKLGKPSSATKPHVEEATGRTVQTRTYRKHGLEITYSRDTEYQSWVIERFQARTPCAWKNPQGIGIGTPEATVRSRYAGLEEKETSNAHQLVVGSVYDGVIFAFENGKVESIFIGAAAE